MWLLTLILVPLAFLSPTYVLSEAVIAYVEVPKIAVLRTLVGMMTILWLLEWGIQGGIPLVGPEGFKSLQAIPKNWLPRLKGWLRERPGRWVFLMVWFYLGATLISTIFSASFRVSLWGEVPGQDGFTAYTTLALVLLFAVIATHLKTGVQLGRLLGTLVVVGILVSGYGVLQHYGNDFLGILEATGGSRNAVTSFMANADFSGAAMFLPLTISLALAAATLKEPVIGKSGVWAQVMPWVLSGAAAAFWVLALAVQLLGLAFTLTRGSWVGALAALVVFLLLAAIFGGWRALGRAGLVLGLASGATLIALQWPGSISWFTGGVGLALILILMGTLGVTAAFVARGAVGGYALGLGRVLPWSGMALGSMTVLAVVALLALGSLGEDSLFAKVGGDTPAARVLSRFGSVRSEVVSGSLTGRGDIWTASWRLIQVRPWFEYEELSLPWLRPIVGYGPDLFRYAFLLESLAKGGLPMEPNHAHNVYIHQTVEQGVLGLLASVGIFAVPLLVGGYQLLRGRRNYSLLQLLLLIGLLATFAGRSIEQTVGLARVSDLTIFWVLLAAIVALPRALTASLSEPETLEPKTRGVIRNAARGRHRRNRGRSRGRRGVENIDWAMFSRFMVIAVLVGGIATVTGLRTVSYPRAAVAAGQAVKNFQQGDYQGALAGLERASQLAPDVSVYYTHQSSIYAAFLKNPRGVREHECSLGMGGVPYETCLVQKTYLVNRASVDQRPYYWRSRLALANSALALGFNDEAIRLYTEVVATVPNSWPLQNRLAEAYIDVGQPERAVEVLRESLAITGESRMPGQTRQLLELANQKLEEQNARDSGS